MSAGAPSCQIPYALAVSATPLWQCELFTGTSGWCHFPRFLAGTGDLANPSPGPTALDLGFQLSNPDLGPTALDRGLHLGRPEIKRHRRSLGSGRFPLAVPVKSLMGEELNANEITKRRATGRSCLRAGRHHRREGC